MARPAPCVADNSLAAFADARLVHVGQHHVGPFAGEAAGDFEAESLSRARHDRHFALQPAAAGARQAKRFADTTRLPNLR